ncbi:hypothetical protein VPH35_063632 [Triticum aestivum]|uniref:Phytosulfokine receptor 1 n=1 Tax=Aegilops tauschii TaxID=37682 RepID=N1R4E9_AEGTA
MAAIVMEMEEGKDHGGGFALDERGGGFALDERGRDRDKRTASKNANYCKNQGQVLDYSNNTFSSTMPNFTAYLGQTAYLKLSKNNISGSIPYSICDARKLEVLDLSHNNFNGLMPSCLIEGRSLAILNLRENDFEGTLPYYVNENCNLQTIGLHGNKFEGRLPRSLSTCVDMEVLDIGKNQMVDTFPSWLRRLSNLRVLVLRSNQFYGSLAYPPRDEKIREYFPKLQIIDISSNNFSGGLDAQWFKSLSSMMAKSNNTGYVLGRQMSHSSSYYHDTLAITYKGQYVTFEKILSTLTIVDFSNNALDGDIP